MTKLSKIGPTTPLNEDLILYWERSGHIERGYLVDAEGEFVHFLPFDGEHLDHEPTHWMEIPEIKNE